MEKTAKIKRLSANKGVIFFNILFFGISSVFARGLSIIDEGSPSKKKYESYLIAELELARGNLSEAEKQFEKFSKFGEGRRAQHGLLRTWLKAGKYSLIAQQINDFDVKDLEVQLAFIMAYLNTKHFDKAETLLTKLYKIYAKNEQVAYFYALLFLETKREAKALTFVDSFLASLDTLNPRHSFFYFLKSRIYVQMGKTELALNSIDKSLKLYPQFKKGWLLKALLAEQVKKIDSAIDAYRSYLNFVGKDAQVIRKLVLLLFSNNRFQEAEKELKKIPIDSEEYFFDLALIQAKGENFKEALQNTDKALAKNKNLFQAKILRVEVLLKQGQTDSATEYVFKWIEQNPADKMGLAMFPALKNSGVRKEKLISMLHGVIDKGIAHKNLLAVLSDLYVDIKKLRAALPYHKQILELTKDELLKSKVFYQMGYTYLVSGEGEKVEEYLKKSLSGAEVYLPAYNLLAYYYADTEKNLEYALELIDKALVFEPENSVFLDTKGYVLLKLGKFLEAKRVFRRALFISPKDNLIQEHLKLANK